MPVHWSPSSQTGLAESELEYKEDHKSKSVLVKYKVVNSNKLNLDKDLFLVIWTTTPWTLIANQAICCNNQAKYALLEGKEWILFSGFS